MKLVRDKDGTELKAGDKVITFLGAQGILDGWREPYSPASTGRVYVIVNTISHEWFPGVIDAHFEE